MSGSAQEPTLARRLAVARRTASVAGTLARRLRGGSGRVIGGRVLLALDPGAVRRLTRGRRVTLVSGTNGKSTTTALVVAALGAQRRVATNADGANTGASLAGLVAAAGDADELVLEVDEGWLPWAIQQTSPRLVVLSNLSRDQLSRHHEVAAVAAAWREALVDVPEVVANADDPAVAWAALGSPRQVWVAVGAPWTADSLVCPACAGALKRSESDWACASCDLRRPEPRWRLEGPMLDGPEATLRLDLALPGRFNLANAALAVVAARQGSAVPVLAAAARLGSVESVAGRFEVVRTGDHELRIMLAKNPAGWLELLEVLRDERHPLVLLLNADGVDGRDPSWLYDVSFAPLRGRRVLVQGSRATDFLVRLEHDGVEAEAVPGDLAAALARLPARRVDVVGNYTAFRAVVQEVHRG